MLEWRSSDCLEPRSSCTDPGRLAETMMPTSPASLPWNRVAILALGLVALAVPGRPVWGTSPAAPEAAPSPAAQAAPPAAPAGPGRFDFAGQREEVFKAFYSTGLDNATAYAVTNLAIKKDTMTLLLKQGTVFLMKTIGGEVTGGTFVGD